VLRHRDTGMDRTETLSSEVTVVQPTGMSEYRRSRLSSNATVAEKQPDIIVVSDPPDGGLEAWTVVFASSLTLFASFGIANSYVSKVIRDIP
jgi:hypothetical protein